MSDFFELLLLVIALCADAFTASFVYGADRVKIPFLSAAIITLLSTGILAAFLLAGTVIRPFFPGNTAALLSAALLFFLGLGKCMAGPVKDVARQANDQEPEVLSAKEAFLLGIALSLDSAAAGIGTGLSGSSWPLLLFLSLASGFLAILGGSFLGKLVSGWTHLDFSRMSGVILILLAVLKLI